MMWFLPAMVIGYAQQSGTKPVLSAKPAEPTAPPPPTPSAAQEAGPVSVDKNYVIGADDSVLVTVWKETQLSGTMTVRPDGKISLPLVNDVVAAGLTPMQLATEITNRLTKFVTDPVVSVSVVSVKSKRIFLTGEIGRPGPLDMTPGMTILQAISAAGGPTLYANKKHMYILRGDSSNQQKIPFDYTKAMKKGDMQGVSLLPGDTIVVP
jgi:polysaccharide biosynthesis/export protein